MRQSNNSDGEIYPSQAAHAGEAMGQRSQQREWRAAARDRWGRAGTKEKEETYATKAFWSML